MQKKRLFTTLRYMREKLNVTQEDFAKLIGCGIPNYANKENGKVPWSLDECTTLRDFINERLNLKGNDAYTIDLLFTPDIVPKRATYKRKATKKSSEGA